jgi:OmpA-OmpF porin, OOP family
LAPFQARDLNAQLAQYTKKVDNFMVILDASSSMNEDYHGGKKLALAKNMVNGMNQTIPGLYLNGALRTFGHSWCPFSKKTRLIYGPALHDKTVFEQALQTVNFAGGQSPMGLAVQAAAKDLQSAQGDMAVIIVSDAEDMGEAPLAAANDMKSQYGDRLCIYTVLVGDDSGGRTLMEKLAGAGRCGFMVNADDIMTADGMADFVKKVFLERAKAAPVLDSDGDGVPDDSDRCPNTPRGVKVDVYGCPLDSDGDGVPDYLDRCPNTPRGVKVDPHGCPLDSDGDGVPDYLDQCPGTPKGATVNRVGCWVLPGAVLFDTNKADIKPEAFAGLDEVVKIFEENPDLAAEVQGHTDSTGAEAYNQQLSERRANAVLDYLLSRGVRADQLTAKGYGELRPVASNDTEEGRRENRRVELRPDR